jgi:hypothetical protein
MDVELEAAGVADALADAVLRLPVAELIGLRDCLGGVVALTALARMFSNSTTLMRVHLSTGCYNFQPSWLHGAPLGRALRGAVRCAACTSKLMTCCTPACRQC